MPQGLVGSNPVVVLASDLFTLQDATGFQVGNDPLHGTLGNPDLQGNFTQHDGRVPG